jgi:hypothetical protein
MRGIQIIETYLTHEERKRFLDNLHTENVHADDLLNLEWNDMKEFISSSFIWSLTPEGFGYWDVIFDRVRFNHKIEELRPIKHLRRMCL